MSNSLSRLFTLMLFLALAVPTTVLAQTPETADVHGVVLDKSGQPVSGYKMKLVTPEQTQVVMNSTEHDGGFGVEGLPPGTYEFRVFDPGGSTDNPIASKKVTLAAGQKEKIEIRLSAVNSGGAAEGGLTAGTTLSAIGNNLRTVVIAGLVLVAALVVIFMVRSQRSAGA